jgi:hypothetical protein
LILPDDGSRATEVATVNKKETFSERNTSGELSYSEKQR